ncbi:Uncharacterised protein [Legionella lansingensis]|uniref:Uncharacterized protein n=1 Tax=Legionella lansingensis TaxID=45067 RepID=A0A0W0VMM0_9GAMM|nr:hypothetical protein [Legionella lansingensis]KTD21403.1 hypothetical protein Llan_1566 [Legionella lansingensis]SNV51914.1 Uncharacterised protein [Legionella lansingensis]
MPKIIHNLDEFAEKLVTAISEGGQILTTCLEKAKIDYGNENSLFWSWLYSVSRRRGGDFEKAIQALKDFDMGVIRLQEFQKFFSAGTWKQNSANTKLFIFLINAVQGYDKETDDYLRQTVIPDLRVLILEKIKILLRQEELNAKRVAEREEEKKRICAEKNRQLDSIVLFNEKESAKLFALKNQDHYTFYLNVQDIDADNPKWDLIWYDLTGKAIPLTISPELTIILKRIEDELKNFLKFKPATQEVGEASQAKDKLLAELMKKSASAHELKIGCKNIVDALLKKNQVLFNPDASQLQDLVSTYVLKKESDAFQLYWYDSLGKENLIKLKDYSDLDSWLVQKTDLSANNFLALKMQLRYVNTRQNVDESKQKSIQNLLNQRHGITLITSDDWTTIPPYKLIKDTYILIREPNPTTGKWSLYQRQRGGKNAVIELASWTNEEASNKFKKILADNNGLSAAGLGVEAIQGLRDCIKHSNTPTSVLACRAMKVFPPKVDTYCKPCSYVLTKENNHWQLYYINAFQENIKVQMSACPQETQDLLLQWQDEVEAVTFEQLNNLVKTLTDFKPEATNRINLEQFSKLEAVLREGPKSVNEATKLANEDSEIAHKEDNEETPAVLGTPKSGKLDISKYAAVATLFGDKTIMAKRKALAQESAKEPIVTSQESPEGGVDPSHSAVLGC